MFAQKYRLGMLMRSPPPPGWVRVASGGDGLKVREQSYGRSTTPIRPEWRRTEIAVLEGYVTCFW